MNREYILVPQEIGPDGPTIYLVYLQIDSIEERRLVGAIHYVGNNGHAGWKIIAFGCLLFPRDTGPRFASAQEAKDEFIKLYPKQQMRNKAKKCR
jgi:hypothetical protein